MSDNAGPYGLALAFCGKTHSKLTEMTYVTLKHCSWILQNGLKPIKSGSVHYGC